MGIRINIEWNFVSPSLEIASGIVTVYNIPTVNQPVELFKCNCKIERSGVGFSAISNSETIPSKLFNLLDGHIKTMMYSYFDGMRLDKYMFHWVDDTLNDSFELKEWIDKHNENKQ